MKKYSVADINENNITEIATHFLESGLSLRAFASTFCTFSHVTLRSKFYRLLPLVNTNLYEQVIAKLEQNRAKNIKEDPESRLRVLLAVKYLIESDLTIPEIAEKLGSTEFIIYRDLTTRMMELEELNNDVKRQVLLKLQDHKRYNLIQRR